MIRNVVFKKNLGMTLVEIMVAISILGVLAGIIVVGATAARKRARINKAKSEMGLYASAIIQYHNEHKYEPVALDRWPAETNVRNCNNALLYPVPDAVVAAKLWKAGDCLPYAYLNRNGTTLIAIGWSGLDGDLSTKEDNYGLLIRGEKSKLEEIIGDETAKDKAGSTIIYP